MVVLVSGEIFARYYLGLGTPPLSFAHPKIEYMFKPDQDVYRFGNRILVNQYGMRTVPFDGNKAEGEIRIMAFGDSVLNGGNLTDHAALATTILQETISKSKQKAIVGNISAGSWGPGNWLAYAKEYGFFGADIVVLVISSHDYSDNPTFAALNEDTHPTQSPVSAFFEGVERYLPRYLPRLDTGGAVNESDRFAEKVSEQELINGLNDLKHFVELAKRNSTNVLVIQHWEKSEIEKRSAKHEDPRVREIFKEMGIYPISLDSYFRQSIENGINPYRDNIHPNHIGQKLIANALLDNVTNKIGCHQ